jgi:L-arabinose isomerase
MEEIMLKSKNYQFWFATGSQDLYGDECLREVAEHSRIIVEELNKSGLLPFEVIWKPTLIDSSSIRKCFNEANADERCAGVITWMHTFSPAKMWILGLQEYRKPLMHLHTQYNREIPFESIDMDFMNTNQSAHGDREYGHIVTRMGIERKVIVGHWSDETVINRIAGWMRTAIGIMESSHIRVLRVGDNMRDVAVTEGDKVEAEIKFGWEIDAYNITDIAQSIDSISDAQGEALLEEYYASYDIILAGRDAKEFRRHVKEQALIELGFRKFLEDHDYHAVVTNFQMLSGLKQLPGLAMQRLMADGYGFGGEGDWKTAAMVRLMKIMAEGLPKGTSFMEDYTYHLEPGKEAILQSHMLEVCPSISNVKPSIMVNPLSMGNREDPARLVFTTKPGDGVACSLVDMGTRFRLIVNDVTSLKQDIPMPKLPVATALWKPQPNLMTGAEAWILAGGAHHTAFSLDLTSDQIADWGEAMGIEVLRINKDTTIHSFKNEIRWNQAFYR